MLQRLGSAGCREDEADKAASSRSVLRCDFSSYRRCRGGWLPRSVGWNQRVANICTCLKRNRDTRTQREEIYSSVVFTAIQTKRKEKYTIHQRIGIKHLLAASCAHRFQLASQQNKCCCRNSATSNCCTLTIGEMGTNVLMLHVFIIRVCMYNGSGS
jgi:hypothetical protein